MTVFVDTSAFIAVLDADSTDHETARRTWADLLQRDVVLLTTNYVLVESLALIQRRLGIEATRAFQEDIVPILSVEWLDAAMHHAAVAALLIAGRRQLSLVDCASFQTMRRRGIGTAFTLDRHFAEQGFVCPL